MSDWISIEDRLPEAGVRVLLVCVDRAETILHTGRRWHVKQDTAWWSVPSFYEVTHWMPLPEPPRSKDG